MKKTEKKWFFAFFGVKNEPAGEALLEFLNSNKFKPGEWVVIETSANYITVYYYATKQLREN